MYSIFLNKWVKLILGIVMFAWFFPLKFDWTVFSAILSASFISRSFWSLNCFKGFLIVAVNNFLLNVFLYSFLFCFYFFKPNPNFILAFKAIVSSFFEITYCQAFLDKIRSAWWLVCLSLHCEHAVFCSLQAAFNKFCCFVSSC